MTGLTSRLPSPAPDTPLDQVDFAVVDVETTGLSAERGDRVCEIGIVRLRGGAVLGTLGTLVNPTVPVSAGAYAVNGISPAMLAGAPLFPQILPEVSSMLSGAVLAAYNAPFDVGFLASEFRLGGSRPVEATVVDVLALARRLIPGRRSYAQSSIAALLGIGPGVRHRALEDAIVTSKILTHALSLLKAHGRSTLGDLLRSDLGRSIAAERAARIARALDAGGDLWIRYLSPSDGEVTQRIVTPLGRGSGSPAPRGSGTRDRRGAPVACASPEVLEAFCHVLQANRRFRIDCILDVRPVGPSG